MNCVVFLGYRLMHNILLLGGLGKAIRMAAKSCKPINMLNQLQQR
jgi:hypothetical protein